MGYDQEKLNSLANTKYSGGVYYRYYRAGAKGALGGLVPANTNYVRVRRYQSGGEFDSENTAFYVQDDWSVTDRLTLNLGVRSENFLNKNASGNPFTEINDQVAARVGATYDLFGDRRTKVSAFYGRYYLPVAANTNIRLAGNEKFTQDWYLFSSIDPKTLVPALSGAALREEVLSDSNNANPKTLTASNLDPQFQDEYIVGVEHQFENTWKVGVNIVRRELKSVLEDFDMSYIQDKFCNSSSRPSSLSLSDCQDGHFGGGGNYVLINPGKAILTSFQRPDGSLVDVSVPGNIADLPKAVREFTSVELSFERPFDGKWGLAGSYVWSKSEGNYEGGVKSDNGQDDTGLTQDFDEPGWMDGSYGPLPNEREHTFKLYGTYAPFKNFTVGGNLFVQSGRKFGCIGVYPFDDGRATTSSAASWYCGGKLTPRGSQFQGDWVTRFDINGVYSVPLDMGKVDFRVDIFNVFDLDTPVDYRELGEDDGGTADPFYRAPTSYQAPRSVRLGMSYKF